MRIVVATFGDESGTGALEYAADLLEGPGHELLVVHAVSDDRSLEESRDGDAPGRAMLDHAERYGDSADVSVETALLWGPPTESIPQYVEDRDADLLVLGRPLDAPFAGTSTPIRLIVGRLSIPASIVPISGTTDRIDGRSHGDSPGR